MVQGRQRNTWVDLIRVGSILYIVGFWHLFGYADGISFTNRTSMSIAITALAAFVMISGYFLGRAPLTWSRRSIADFYWQRFLRIYVPFAIGAVLFFVVLRSSGTSLAKALLGISMFEGPAPMTLWFASMIIVFYLIAPLLIITRKHPLTFLGICLCFIAICLAIEAVFNDLDWRVLLYLPCFAAGIWFAGNEMLSKTATIAWLLLLSLVSMAVLVTIPLSEVPFSMATAPWAFASSALLLALALRAKPIRPIFVVSFLGTASYFMYLLHRPVFELFLRLFSPANDFAILATLLLLALPATIAASWLLQAGYNSLLATVFLRPTNTLPR